jgi:hypothetical protein
MGPEAEGRAAQQPLGPDLPTTPPPSRTAAPSITEGHIGDARPPLLVDSAWSFAEQCQRLVTSKAYRRWDDDA